MVAMTGSRGQGISVEALIQVMSLAELAALIVAQEDALSEATCETLADDSSPTVRPNEA